MAYLARKWKLPDKILSCEKTIESRWYVNRSAPWDRIAEGDTVYFKESGYPVRVIATVSRVLQYDNLNEEVYRNNFDKYGKAIGIVFYCYYNILPL